MLGLTLTSAIATSLWGWYHTKHRGGQSTTARPSLPVVIVNKLKNKQRSRLVTKQAITAEEAQTYLSIETRGVSIEPESFSATQHTSSPDATADHTYAEILEETSSEAVEYNDATDESIHLGLIEAHDEQQTYEQEFVEIPDDGIETSYVDELSASIESISIDCDEGQKDKENLDDKDTIDPDDFDMDEIDDNLNLDEAIEEIFEEYEADTEQANDIADEIDVMALPQADQDENGVWYSTDYTLEGYSTLAISNSDEDEIDERVVEPSFVKRATEQTVHWSTFSSAYFARSEHARANTVTDNYTQESEKLTSHSLTL